MIHFNDPYSIMSFSRLIYEKKPLFLWQNSTLYDSFSMITLLAWIISLPFVFFFKFILENKVISTLASTIVELSIKFLFNASPYVQTNEPVKICVQLSKLAYQWRVSHCMKDIHKINKHLMLSEDSYYSYDHIGLRIIICHKPNDTNQKKGSLYIIFRGTNPTNIMNILTDLSGRLDVFQPMLSDINKNQHFNFFNMIFRNWLHMDASLKSYFVNNNFVTPDKNSPEWISYENLVNNSTLNTNDKNSALFLSKNTILNYPFVHSGFQLLLFYKRSCRDISPIEFIQHTIKQFKNTYHDGLDNIYITGHSMGACLADITSVIIASDVHSDQPFKSTKYHFDTHEQFKIIQQNNVRITNISFASSTIGNSSFYEYMYILENTSLFTRLEFYYDQDLLTRFFLSSDLYGWHYSQNKNHPFDLFKLKFTNGKPLNLSRILMYPWKTIFDHHVNNYANAIMKNENKLYIDNYIKYISNKQRDFNIIYPLNL
tara:strand:+ start:1902 stop:3359 length:1458 start_codon:yes stop_codon:yes gene_type:complete